MTAGAFALALYLRVGDGLVPYYSDVLAYGTATLVAVAAVTYRVLGLYRGIWRFASVPDLVTMTKAVTITVLSFVLVAFLITRLDNLPRSVPLILWFVLLVTLGAPRFLYRLFKDRRLERLTLVDRALRIPILLVGANDRAELLIRSLGNDRSSTYRVVAILDDKGRRVGRAIHGVPVLGRVEDFRRVVEQLDGQGKRPQRIVLAKSHGELDGAMVRRLFDEEIFPVCSPEYLRGREPPRRVADLLGEILEPRSRI